MHSHFRFKSHENKAVGIIAIQFFYEVFSLRFGGEMLNDIKNAFLRVESPIAFSCAIGGMRSKWRRVWNGF